LPISPSGFSDTEPAVSPDGSQVAFIREDLGGNATSTVAVVHNDGSSYAALTDGQSNDLDPSWSPDGTKVVFSHGTVDSGQCCNYDIYQMNADGSSPAQLTNYPHQDFHP